MERKKSKTNLLQKFAYKFKKKKKRSKSTSASRERSSEYSRNRSPGSKSNKTAAGSAQTGTTPSAESKSKIDLMEVTAKGVRSKKDIKDKRGSVKKKNKEKDKEKDKEKENNCAPTKTSTALSLRRADSLMELSQNSKVVEKSMKLWIETLEKADFKKWMEADFKPIDAMKVDMEKCQAFKKNLDYCQSEYVEVLDSNRVKGNGEADFFYHGSLLNLTPITSKTTILAQLADIDSSQSLESFWLMVAGQKITRMYVLCGEKDEELDEETRNVYFPTDFFEFKTIRVNNRKTVPKSDPDQPNTQMYYEVVPEDCAEAPFCMIEICDFWTDASIPTSQYGRIAATAATVFQTDIDADASCAIVSNYGAGRAGAFLVGALAIEKLRNGEQPNIKEIALMVRSQRPAAIETLFQYVFTHIIALYYGMKHVKDGELKARIQTFISQLETFGAAKMEEEDDDESNTSTNSNTLE